MSENIEHGSIKICHMHENKYVFYLKLFELPLVSMKLLAKPFSVTLMQNISIISIMIIIQSACKKAYYRGFATPSVNSIMLSNYYFHSMKKETSTIVAIQ